MADRIRTEPADFFSIINKGDKYTDSGFPRGDAFYWADQGEYNSGGALYYQNNLWERAQTAFPTATLYGSNGVTPADIRQGSLGDCWFMSSASALAEVPGRLESVFVNDSNAQNSAGVYAVNFHALGLPTTIVVDDYLPVEKKYDGSYSSKYARLGDDNSIWGAILEKAFAKFMGNYAHIESGAVSLGVHYLNGSPFSYVDNASVSKSDLWTTLVNADQANDIINASTHKPPKKVTGTAHDYQNARGLSYSHAYTVLGVTEVDGNKLVKMRNPWGAEKYEGPWSDSDTTNWTEARKA